MAPEDPAADGADAPGGRVFIVDDHALLAQALGLNLSSHGFTCQVATLGSLDEIREQVRLFAPTVVLLDLNLAGVSGLDLVAPIAATGARVVMVSGSAQESRLSAALALGAVGWVHKSQPFEQLLAAAVDAAAGRPLLPASRLAELTDVGRQHLVEERTVNARLARLSPREREVLDALTEGRTVQEIARLLYVSETTVRTHVRAILTKLEVSTQLAAVAAARSLQTPN